MRSKTKQETKSFSGKKIEDLNWNEGLKERKRLFCDSLFHYRERLVYSSIYTGHFFVPLVGSEGEANSAPLHTSRE